MKMKLISSFGLVILYLLFGRSNDGVVYGQTITTYAGNHLYGYSGDGGAATAAKITDPAHAVITASGDLYFTDYYNHVVRKINGSGIISTVFGTGTAGYSGDGGSASSAKLDNPNGIAIDNWGNFYIGDQGNHVVRKIDTTGIIKTVAGNHTAGYSGDGGYATAAEINSTQLRLDNSGSIYIVDYSNNRIRKVNTSGIINTIVGTGTPGSSGDGGPATAAKINQPTGVAFDISGNIYFSDQLNNKIRKINTSGIVSTIAGNGTAAYSGDGGPATAASMFYPSDLVIDNYGNILIADSYNNVIRMVSPSGIISTIVGNGTSGYSGDGGPATAAKLDQPWGIALNACGNLYITDAFNFVIRKVTYTTTLSPITGPDSVCLGTTNTLTDATPGGIWASSDTTIASINVSTGSVLGLVAGNATITYAASSGCGAGFVTYPVTIVSTPNAGTIAIIESSICPGDTIRLNDAATGGTWTSGNTGVATISGSGLATGIAGGTDTVFYIVANACGSDTASTAVSVLSSTICHEGITSNTEFASKMNIFPNPNNGAFTISVSSVFSEEMDVIITNVVGEQIYESRFATNTSKEMQQPMPAGVYLVTAIGNHQRFRTTVVVE